MKETTAWVAPIESLPASLKPIAVMQKKHFGAVLNPTRWWGRMPRLFWLVALFVGFLERRRARLSPVLRSLLMTRVSQLCHCAFCIDANSLRLAERCGALEKVQAGILDACARLVRAGGLLVYSTCTVLPRENGQVVHAFLEKNPDFVPEALPLPTGIVSAETGMLTLIPGQCDTDGFFIARLRRKADR